jgi:hypothetical protein
MYTKHFPKLVVYVFVSTSHTLSSMARVNFVFLFLLVNLCHLVTTTKKSKILIFKKELKF